VHRLSRTEYQNAIRDLLDISPLPKELDYSTLLPTDNVSSGFDPHHRAVIIHHDVLQLLTEEMNKRGIKHTTSECTLRGFTCSLANVDPKTATPAEIARIRTIQTGYQEDGVSGGLEKKQLEKQ